MGLPEGQQKIKKQNRTEQNLKGIAQYINEKVE
jgi:hypothetical protein